MLIKIPLSRNGHSSQTKIAVFTFADSMFIFLEAMLVNQPLKNVRLIHHLPNMAINNMQLASLFIPGRWWQFWLLVVLDLGP